MWLYKSTPVDLFEYFLGANQGNWAAWVLRTWRSQEQRGSWRSSDPHSAGWTVPQLLSFLEKTEHRVRGMHIGIYIDKRMHRDMIQLFPKCHQLRHKQNAYHHHTATQWALLGITVNDHIPCQGCHFLTKECTEHATKNGVRQRGEQGRELSHCSQNEHNNGSILDHTSTANLF